MSDSHHEGECLGIFPVNILQIMFETISDKGFKDPC